MRIIGIDPGSKKTGYALIDLIDNKIEYVAAGVIKINSNSTMPYRILQIYNEIENLLLKFKPHVMATEKVFYSKNSQSILKLGEIRGVLFLLAAKAGISVFEYSPREVKKSVLGYGGALKEQIKKMMKSYFNLKESLPEDAGDALAIALCYNYHRGIFLEDGRNDCEFTRQNRF